ncbi:MAG: hypothetical protein ACE5IQ_00675 [Candidatus Methylomirabilales bacterium]
MRLAETLLLVSLVLGAGACSVPGVAPEGEGTLDVREWQGQIVQLDRDRGVMVVRSQERLLDHVFQITPETEISSQAPVPASLEPGQWVTVQYQKEKSRPGPPAALRVLVIR